MANFASQKMCLLSSVFYRPSSSVSVISFTVLECCSVEEQSLSMGVLPMQKPGLLGCVSATPSLLSIRTTSVIVGLSSLPSCTHKRPICIHRNTLDIGYEHFTALSSSSKHLSSSHNLHAYIIS